MTLPDYVYDKGTLFVAPGGGGAATPLPPGASGQVLGADPTLPLGVGWGAGSSSGNVVGASSSVSGNLPEFADTSGKLLADSGIPSATVAQGPGSSTAHNLAAFADTGGNNLEDSGILTSSVALGAASAVSANFAAFNGTGGKQLEDSGFNSASFRPAPVTGGAAATKGSFTLSSGTHAQIATTAAVTGSVIVYTVVTLGTVSIASSFLTTIQTGVGFTPVASDATDTSVVNWCIVG